MSSKKPAANKKVANRIPSASQYIIPRDPSDPTSKSKFIPAKISLEKSSTGGFRLIPPGAEEAILAKQLEVVFLTTYPESQCRATLRTDDSTVVCYSKNRQRGYKGHDCKTQCPYAERGKDKDSKLYRRPISKTTFFLARKKGETSQFFLVRYSSVLGNIAAVESLKDLIRTKLSSEGSEEPFYTKHIVRIGATTEKVAKGVVGRFSKEVEILEVLTDEEYALVRDLIGRIITLNDEDQARYKKMTEERAESLPPVVEEAAEEPKAQGPKSEPMDDEAPEDEAPKLEDDEDVDAEVNAITGDADPEDEKYF